jgi:nucleotide-binding universal stress UspA family protein
VNRTYRRILVPVSEAAEVEPMIRFASVLLDAGGEIRMLHVIPARSLPQIARQWRSSVNLVVPAHETGAALDVTVEPEVRASPDVPGEILESVESHAIDAILMTLRGDRRSRNPFVGHTATAILQHAATDVLVVNRLALTEQPVNRILLPTFGPTPPPKAMRVAEELALRNPGAVLVALTLASRGGSSERSTPSRSPRGFEFRQRRAFLPERLLGRRHRLPELILQAASRERYGFLIVSEDPGPAGVPLLTRRFVEELFRTAPCPVLAVRG